MAQAEQEFDTFTTVDFPARVQSAQSINIYIDPENGDDTNTGSNTSNAIKTPAAAYTKLGGGSPIYERVNFYFRCGFEYLLDSTVGKAKKTLYVSGWDDENGTLTLKQGFESTGQPAAPFEAEYLYFNEAGNGKLNLIIKTAEYPVGHVWGAGSVQNASWQALVGAFCRSTSKIKFDGCHVELYDLPFNSQYLAGSMSNVASTGIIIAGSTRFYKKASSSGSAAFSHEPYLLHVYGNGKLPLDISSGGFVLAENLTAFGELFSNVSPDNVRSTHSFS